MRNWRTYIAAENDWFRMIRSNRYKYCRFAGGDGGEFLVDLSSDPGELRNLAADPAYQNLLQEHRRTMTDWMTRSGDREAVEFL